MSHDIDWNSIGNWRLINIQGDQVEFAEFLGAEGILCFKEGHEKGFSPNGSGTFLEFSIKEKDESQKDRIVVTTKRKNIFTFERVK